MQKLILKLIIIWMMGLALINANEIMALSHAADFLDNFGGARAMGMGKAFTGHVDDSYATIWNSAALPRLKEQQVFGLVSNTLGIVGNQQIGYALPFNLFFDFGVGICYQESSVDGIWHTTEDALDTGERFGYVGKSMMLAFGCGLITKDRFNELPEGYIGSKLKALSEDMFGYQSLAASLDVDFLILFSPSLTIGLSFADFSLTPLAWNTPDNQAAQLDSSITFGMSNKIWDSFAITIDLKDTKDKKLIYRLGAEYALWQSSFLSLFMRAGINEEYTSLGLGIFEPSFTKLQLDYAYMLPTWDYVESTHTISFRVLL